MSAGTYFGKYFLLKRLAQGGMGEIYIARQSGPGGFSKTVALKKVLPHLTDNKEFIQGFLGEAALSAKMTHRNIVSVFDFGLDDDSNSYFLTMEYVAGKALNQLLEACNARKERIPLALIKDMAVQMCDGISYAHNLTDELGQPLNLVHRDLNPSNLLLSYNGDVKIIDWGIAKSEMSQVKTEAGMIKGKFVYMSPEQSMAKKLDKRSDIFAAGITLYEMLTGENPFHKPNVVLSLEAIQRLDPPPPSEFDPALAGFDPIVAKALAKDRDKRYQDCADMAEDLKTVVVPPSPERLGGFLGRIFRSDLEQEQKLLQETGAAKVPPRSVPGARVASSPGARAPAPQQHQQQHSPADEERGGTLVMGSDSVDQDKLRQQMEAAKAKLLAQQQAAAQRQMQQHQPQYQQQQYQQQYQQPEAVQRTMFIGAADLQPPPPKQGGKGLLIGGIVGGVLLGVIGVGAFFFLQKGGTEPTPVNAVPTPPVQVTAVPPTPPAEEPKAEPAATAHADEAKPVVEEKKPEEKKPEEKKPEATAKVEEKKPEEKKPEEKKPEEKKPEGEKVATAPTKPPEPPAPNPVPVVAKAGGSLLFKTIPPMPVTHGGKELGAGTKIPITGTSGTMEIGDATSPFRITVNYTVNGKVLTAKIASDPWSIAYVNSLSKGKVPLTLELEDSLQKVELKKPGLEQSVTMIMKFAGE